jgi:nitrate reductase gamma subunit
MAVLIAAFGKSGGVLAVQVTGIAVLVAFGLFALWPFTRLVHVFSAPLGYLTRPYLVYRSKDERPGRGTGSRAPQRGWDKPELTQKK